MHSLGKIFRFYVGNLVDEYNEVWIFYTILLQIDEILHLSVILKECLQLLPTLIETHHSMYLELFKQNLKPKHHFLIHYPRVISQIGLPKFISCMQFEAKHKELKEFAKVVTCRTNLPYTIFM